MKRGHAERVIGKNDQTRLASSVDPDKEDDTVGRSNVASSSSSTFDLNRRKQSSMHV